MMSTIYTSIYGHASIWKININSIKSKEKTRIPLEADL